MNRVMNKWFNINYKFPIFMLRNLSIRRLQRKICCIETTQKYFTTIKNYRDR